MVSPFSFATSLKGETIQLESLQPSHIDGLRKAASFEQIWQYNKATQESLSDFLDAYFIDMLNKAESGEQQVYVLIEKKNGQVLGSTRYYDLSPANKRLAIGFTWLTPCVWGTGVNREMKQLSLTDLFERLKLNRVEFHVDSRNERSLAAMAKLGAIQEGVLRRHKIVQGDFVRDTVLFSILAKVSI